MNAKQKSAAHLFPWGHPQSCPHEDTWSPRILLGKKGADTWDKKGLGRHLMVTLRLRNTVSSGKTHALKGSVASWFEEYRP